MLMGWKNCGIRTISSSSMGLDSVELLIEVENTFEVTIPDAVAQEVLTVGDIVAAVCAQLRGQPTTRCRTQHFFYRFRRSLPHSGRSACTPVAPLRALVDTPATYRLLAADTGLNFPPLELPRWYQHTATSLFISYLILLTAGALYYGWWWTGVMVGLAIVLLRIDNRLDAKYRQLVPGVTLRQFVLQLTTRNYREVPYSGYNEREIYSVGREIVIDKMGVAAEEVNPDARLSKDLGID